MTISTNLVNWIKSVIPNAKVKKAPYEGDRPEGEYITYQITSDNQQLWSKKLERVKSAGGMLDETIYFETSITVSINSYSRNGARILGALAASRSSESSIILLSSNGYDLSMSDVTQMPRNLSSLGTEAYRARWQSDFIFNYTVSYTRDAYELRDIKTTGFWDDLEINNDLIQ